MKALDLTLLGGIEDSGNGIRDGAMREHANLVSRGASQSPLSAATQRSPAEWPTTGMGKCAPPT